MPTNPPKTEIELYRDLIQELLEIGRMRLRAIRSRLDALNGKADSATLAALIDDFERTGSAIRRSIMLDMRLAAEQPRAMPPAPTPAQVEVLRQARRHRARMRVIGELEASMRNLTPDP